MWVFYTHIPKNCEAWCVRRTTMKAQYVLFALKLYKTSDWLYGTYLQYCKPGCHGMYDCFEGAFRALGEFSWYSFALSLSLFKWLRPKYVHGIYFLWVWHPLFERHLSTNSLHFNSLLLRPPACNCVIKKARGPTKKGSFVFSRLVPSLLHFGKTY